MRYRYRVYKNLVQKLRAKEAVIGIVGLGYVGLPLALRFAEEGFRVVGFDIDDVKVSKISKSESYIEHISGDRIATAVGKNLSATTDFKKIKDVDAIVLAVPTPLNKHREPDLSYVLDTVESILPHLRKGQVVSLESTTYPGTTDEELKPRIEARGFKVGDDIFLVFSPEREDPGRKDYSTKTIPKVVGGCTKACLDVGVALYNGVIDKVVPVSSTRAAEMTKLLENIHRAVNIGLVNEIKIVCDKMGIDVHEVIDAAATKPFGFVPYYPGPGLGGHCIPIDPFYLTWKAREYNVHTRFIELAGEINAGMPEYVLEKIAFGLNANEKSLKGSKVLILGVAYKEDIDDMRESPSLFLMDMLRKSGAKIAYSDPHVRVMPRLREENHRFDLEHQELSPKMLESYDAVVVATAHKAFDYDMILKHSRLVIDTRGKYRGEYANVVKA